MEFAKEAKAERSIQTDEFQNQALVRMAVAAFMGTYFLFSGFYDHPVYLAFAIYASIIWFVARRITEVPLPQWLIVSTLIGDNAFSVLGLHLTAETGYFLYVLLVQISYGFGVRFGNPYLWLSTGLASAGILALWSWDPYWSGRPHTCVAFALGVPFLSLYFSYLQVRAARTHDSRRFHSSKYSQVVRAFAHDVRSQLQAIRASTEVLAATISSDPTKAAREVQLLEDTTDFLARMTTEEIARSQGWSKTEQKEVRLPMEHIQVGPWLAGVFGRYLIRFSDIECRTQFIFDEMASSAVVIPAGVLNRAISNTLSNTLRYARNGAFTVRVGIEGSTELNLRFRVRMENTIDHYVEGRIVDDNYDPAIYHGAGMGLAITRRLLIEAGGSAKFFRTEINTFVSDLRVPCEGTPARSLGPALDEIVIVSNSVDQVKGAELSECSMARVTHYLSPEAFLELDPGSWGSKIALIFDVSCTEQPAVLTHAKRCNMHVISLASTGMINDAADTQVGLVAVSNLNCAEDVRCAIEFLLATNSRGWQPAGILPTEPRALAGITVLLVDDSEAYLERQRILFQHAGANVHVARIMADAERVLEREHIDSVIVDYFLAHECSERLIRHIVANRAGRRVPSVAVLSGESQEHVAEQLKDCGVDSIFTKPVPFDEIAKFVAHSSGRQNEASLANVGHASRTPEHFDPAFVEELLACGVAQEAVVVLLAK
ncbi:MAG: response regulator, partial [Gammaproteobacteria bacterium]